MVKEESIPSSVKKFRIQNNYFAKCRDGVIVGKRKSKGKHISILNQNNRLTIHSTDPKTNKRKNLFGAENNKEDMDLISADLDRIFKSWASKNPPKIIYAIPNFIFRFDFVLSKNNKECTFIFPNARNLKKSIIKYDFNSFLKSNCFLGMTKLGTGILRYKNSIIVVDKKTEKRFEREIRKIPFFEALSRRC